MSLLWQVGGLCPKVAERDFKRFLRFPVARPFEGAMAENAVWARAWFEAHARGWSCAVRVGEPLRLRMAGRVPEEPAALALIAVSAGPEPEAEAAARWAAEEPDRYYFLECFAAAAVEALLAEARDRLGVQRHYCPGFRGWPVTDNQVLLEALEAAGALPGPLAVLSSGMLKPKKSQLALCALPKGKKREAGPFL